MLILLILMFLFFCWLSVCFRLIVRHPLLTLYYAVRDLVNFFRHKRWNECPTGKLVAYTALFGRGKTLSVVHYIISMYQRYNDVPVYDKQRKKWVRQIVEVISNVQLSIPYENFVSLEQVVAVGERNHKKDLENDTLTITLVLGDEFSVQLNSRDFKKNIDPLFLNTLLTCRHHHIMLVYDAQRFNHVDALLRQVTSYVVECKKVWRFMVHHYYDAYQLECASDPSLVRSQRKTGWFIRDRDFAAYDTLACVGNLKKSFEKGDMMTEDQILALRVNNGNPGIEGVTKPSGYLKRRRKSKPG
ncbi:MAG: hypothetical protein HDQ98_16145 [Lachnospiraceae bacterium]|nr:hypothetical protein [Lachnospiraceae bacterium]MBD5533702.1 hypothetical protein [Lachnospiraceae bacterium]